MAFLLAGVDSPATANERAALKALARGPIEQFQALASDVDPQLFADPDLRLLVTGLLASLPAALIDDQPVAALLLGTIAHAHRHGMPRRIAAELLHHNPPGVDRHALATYLDRLTEEADRRLLRAELVRLAAALECRGGVDRVRARLRPSSVMAGRQLHAQRCAARFDLARCG